MTSPLSRPGPGSRALCVQAKVRRLYDIANVLSSLALIKKVHVTEERGRKPAFKWIGPVDFSTGGKQGAQTELFWCLLSSSSFFCPLR